MPTKEAAHRGIAAALAEPGALPAIVYAGTRAECDRLAARLARELGVEVVAYHAGLRPRRARRGPAALHGRRGAGRRGHERLRHGRRQGRRADGLPRERPRLDRGLLPGGRPRRPRRRARPLPALRRRARQGPARVLHRARRRSSEDAIARGGAPARSAARSTAATTSAPTSCAPQVDGDEDAVRAIVGHLARAGVVQPAPGPPDRVMGRVSGAWDGARAGRLPHLGAARRPARRWRQYRAVWGWVEGDRAGARAILRHFGDRSDPLAAGSRAATSATRRCGRPSPRRPRAGAPAAQLAHRPAGGDAATSTRRSSTSSSAAEPGGRPHARGRDPARRALEGGRPSTPTTACPHYGDLRPPQRGRGARARRRAARRPARCARRAGASRSSAAAATR